MVTVFKKLAVGHDGKVKFARINVLESMKNIEISLSFGVLDPINNNFVEENP